MQIQEPYLKTISRTGILVLLM